MNRKRVIDNWISNYLEHCEDAGLYSKRFEVAKFLDFAALRLWTNKYDPSDVECPFENAEDAEQFAIQTLKEKYSDIIEVFPLEVMYYYGYLYAKQGCFLVDYIFGFDPTYNFEKTDEYYNGHFTSKMEDILVNKLGVKRLIK